LDQRLRSKALAIISSQKHEGTIIRLSAEAQQEGLYEGMPVSLARKMTHSAIFLPRNESLYNRMGQYIYQIVSSFSPLSEPVENGQYYIDMSGMEAITRSVRQTAYTILKEIEGKSNLSALLGIGSNKLITRVSTLTVPELIYEVPQGSEPRFMAPLYAHILPVTKEKSVKKILEFLFLRHVQDIQSITAQREAASLLFGEFTPRVTLEAMGLDKSPVTPPREEAAITRQEILSSDTNDTLILEAIIQTLAGQIGFELRQRKQTAASIALEIHYSDGFKNIRRDKNSANDDRSLTALCLRLFEAANYRRNRIRSVIIHANKLRPYVNQLDLFAGKKTDFERLQKAVDRIRVRFGPQSIQSAAALNALRRKKQAA
jgi:hypothetical protein